MRGIQGTVYLLAFGLTCLFFMGQGCKHEGKDSFQKTGNPLIDELSGKIAKDGKKPELYFARGREFYKGQQYDAAISDLENAIALDSTQADYYHFLADAYLDYSRSRQALFVMETAARRFPSRIPTLLKLSEYQLILQQYDAAIATLQQIFVQDPQEPEAFFMQGRVYEEKGDTSKAMISFQKAIDFDEDLVDAWLHLANLYAARKDPKAMQYFNSASLIGKETPYVLYAKAYYQQQRKQYPAALKGYDEVIRLDKDYADAYFNKGFIYMEMDSLDKAYEHFDIAVKVDPTFVKGYFYRGLSNFEKGRLKEAEKDFQQTLKLDPDFERAKTALAMVQMEIKKSS